jgi:hypothetical protein
MAISRAEAHMLLSAVLLDTINMNPVSGRGTQLDFDIADKLAAHAGVTNTTSMYDELFTAKQDVAALTANELLRKDYKEYVAGGLKIGIASVPTPLTNLLAKPDGPNAHEVFCAGNGLDVLIVMAAYNNPDTQAFTRELICLTTPPHTSTHLPALQALLLGADLGLELLIPANLWTAAAAYTQTNIKASRKVVAPLILTYRQSESSP